MGQKVLVIGSGAIITAHACTQICLTFHSIFKALSIISLYFGLLSYADLNSILSSKACFNFVHGFSGISFASSFISQNSTQKTLHTSFTRARAAKVPKVQI